MAVRILRRDHGLAVVEPPGDVALGFTLAVKAPGQLAFVREDAGGGLEREIAIARMMESVVSVDDIAFRFLAYRTVLGVSARTFLDRQRDEGGALDDVVAGTIASAVAAFVADFRSITGSAPAVSVDDVWLGWDGSVRVFAAGAPGIVDERVPRSASTGDANALAGVLAAIFREERARDLEWHEELFIEDITEADPALTSGPSLQELTHRAIVVDDGLGLPFVVTDLVPWSVAVALSHTESFLQKFATLPPSAAPVTGIGVYEAMQTAWLLDPARAANFWRLPNASEFQRYARNGGLGIASTAGVRGLCRVWEWTQTPDPREGYVVCGGPWRNRRTLPSVDNVSNEIQAARDVGFRAVRYLHDEDAPWEPRT